MNYILLGLAAIGCVIVSAHIINLPTDSYLYLIALSSAIAGYIFGVGLHGNPEEFW